MLTIVMYHFVRDPERTAFPRIRARRVDELEAQLDHVAREYEIVSCADVVAAYERSSPLPDNACLLSFDDGLREHLETVAPALRSRGLTACFAPPARAVLERRVLDVQKSQFVLAAFEDHAALVDRILELAPGHDAAALRRRFARPGRYDGPDTMLAKRLLQDALPERTVLDRLFAEHVASDERAFADELYLTLDEVRELRSLGMDVAGHGHAHLRLDLLDEDAQRDEIRLTKEFLTTVHGSEPERWTMTYAYGTRDHTTLRLLREAGCALGLTTDVGVASLEHDPLELPRLNTNDLPVTPVQLPA